MSNESLSMKIGLDFDKVVYDKSGVVNLMVSLSAPNVESQHKRNPLCICAVIDRSGSMGGSRLDNVRHSLWKMIDHMTEEDSLSLVFFDNQIETRQFRMMTSANKEAIKQEISQIYARGSTDIGSALVAAGNMFVNYEGAANAVERIMLLTDGEANQGATKVSQFRPIINAIRKGVAISTFGYGTGFNEELLTDIAKNASGNPYFIENVDMVGKVFAVELGGLLTCFAQDIAIAIHPHKGAEVDNVLNDMDVDTTQDADGEMTTSIKVGDIYSGEKRDVIIRLKFEKRAQALPRPVTLADVKLNYRDVSNSQITQDNAKVKVQLVKTSAEVPSTPDKEIAEQVAILEAAQVMMKAKRMADAGDWEKAQECIVTCSTSLKQFGSEKTSAFAVGMENFANQINSSYCAGGNLSKTIGNYAYATSSSRGVTAFGNSAGEALDVQDGMNDVLLSLVNEFDTSDSSTTTVTPYSKIRKSK